MKKKLLLFLSIFTFVANSFAQLSFAPAITYATGSRPSSITNADFNGDGNPDLATSNANANNISILLGSSTGTFAAAINYSVGALP
jgi:hypothetical protein